MVLTLTEFFNGLFSLFIVLIFIVVGLLTVLKYRKIKNRIYIWWGIGLLGLGLPWSSGGLSFLMIILTGTALSLELYLFMSLFFISITLMPWLWTLTELMYKDKQKIILGFFAITGIIFEIYLLYYLVTDPQVIGVFVDPPLDINYVGLTRLYAIFILIIVGVSLLLFIRESFLLEEPEIKLKAKFLLIGIISFIIGSILDGYVGVNIVLVFIVRILL
ncbi:MAG: hypothetical protein ACFFHV_19715, partial [Promethearchaeota archaeon]